MVATLGRDEPGSSWLGPLAEFHRGFVCLRSGDGEEGCTQRPREQPGQVLCQRCLQPVGGDLERVDDLVVQAESLRRDDPGVVVAEVQDSARRGKVSDHPPPAEVQLRSLGPYDVELVHPEGPVDSVEARVHVPAVRFEVVDGAPVECLFERQQPHPSVTGMTVSDQ